MCWFDTFTYWNIIATVELANTTITSHNYFWGVVVEGGNNED